MASRRAAIRKKVQKLLLGKTDAGQSVFTNAAAPTWHEDLPVILIYPRSESITKFNQAPRELRRDLELVIEVIAEGAENAVDPNASKYVDDELDRIADQVECALVLDQTWGDTVDDQILVANEFDFVAEGSKPIGSARLVYTATYVEESPPRAKQKGISDFVQANTEWQVGHDNAAPDNVVEAQDEVEIPQT